MIIADIHTHSYFSGDSNEPMENQINSAISKGLKHLCFTEHMDVDYPDSDELSGKVFLLDTDSYISEFLEMKAKNKDKINLLLGVEIGLQPHLASFHQEYVKKYPFDFIIGSEHITNKRDPYYPDFYSGRSEYEAYSEYFKDIVTNLKAFHDFDAFGHLDYVVRYGPNKNLDYSYTRYSDQIDEILELLVKYDIALEVNSGGYKYGLGLPNPSIEIIKRYKELSGKLITVGSDAHDTSRICGDFDKLEKVILQSGFHSYYIFKNRQPVEMPI